MSRWIASLASLFLVSGCLSMSGCNRDEQSTTVGSGGIGGHDSGVGGAGSGADSSSSGSSGGTGGAGGGGGGGAGGNCIKEGHAAGERFSVGDNCNFCDCHADGSTVCTSRTCVASMPGCTYDGVDHAYAEHFPATDGCNECVCAASGLACTRRSCSTSEEGAILMESLDTQCGPDPTFTGAFVLGGLPVSDLVAPFLYDTMGPLYPETLPDTKVRFRVVYDGGFIVCRIPAPNQEAFDIEVLSEWMTEDGSFDEGFHTYLRRNAKGFVTDWSVLASAPPGGLNGTYDPACLDPSGFGFYATIHDDGTAAGDVSKACETDISLTVGTFSYAP